MNFGDFPDLDDIFPNLNALDPNAIINIEAELQNIANQAQPAQEQQPNVPLENLLFTELTALVEEGFLKRGFVTSVMKAESLMMKGTTIRDEIAKFLEKTGCALNDLRERLFNSDSCADTFFKLAESIARLSSSVGATTLLNQARDYQANCNGRIHDAAILVSRLDQMMESLQGFKVRVQRLLKLAERARYGDFGPPFQPPQNHQCQGSNQGIFRLVLEFQLNRPLVKLIHWIVDEDGLVKDSASPLLKRTREQIRLVEKEFSLT
ncbi:hypothetical protein MLD38_015906 [Melastoma candidum]|uniref:Uncharacterized protein n=1 Tax=Melastoma candidum TaxID=119954 RepID=A0ACB9RKR7_9MYRT|nr:hypothetical protein MLD38_015906 [Melastoma candidum]